VIHSIADFGGEINWLGKAFHRITQKTGIPLNFPLT